MRPNTRHTPKTRTSWRDVHVPLCRRALCRVCTVGLPAVLHGGRSSNQPPHRECARANSPALLAGQARVVMLGPLAPALRGNVAVRGGQSPLIRGGEREHGVGEDAPPGKHYQRVPLPVGRVAVPAVEEWLSSSSWRILWCGGAAVGTAPPAGHYPEMVAAPLLTPPPRIPIPGSI